MKFSLFTDYGARNSVDIFRLFGNSLRANGHDVVFNDRNSGIPVIWSVLWAGRMLPNKEIFYQAQKNKTPVVVLEVGSLIRGVTWKVGINGINRDADWLGLTNRAESGLTRAQQLGLKINPPSLVGENILICCQHSNSHQWKGKPPTEIWLDNMIRDIRMFTSRNIIVRPHPRCPIKFNPTKYYKVTVETPKKIPGTYDDFDLHFDDTRVVINESSTPAISAALQGIPVYTSSASMAYPVSIKDLADIEIFPYVGERLTWFKSLVNSEYTTQEIGNGIAVHDLTNALESFIINA